jgi:hypothetical protein
MEMGLVVVGAFEHGSNAQGIIRPSGFVDSLDQMVNAFNAGHLGILNKTSRNDSAKSGGQKPENLPTFGSIIVHSPCWPDWHWQRQDAKFDERLHEEKCD